jgi:DNA-binding response OmpR family regulator
MMQRPAEGRPQPRPEHASARILIIEGDESSSQTWARFFTLEGYITITAADGESALTAVAADRFDLIIADQQLGDLTVLDLLRRFRAADVRTPVVVVTGFGTIEAAVQAMRLGAIDYVQKPLDLAQMLHFVRTTLASGVDDMTAASSYATVRWADAVAKILAASRDVRTIEQWAHEIGAAPGTIRNWCRTAKLSARRSLLLGRLLRAVHKSGGRIWRPEELLDVTDVRTLNKLLSLGGLSRPLRHVSIADVFAGQRLIDESGAVRELQAAITRCLAGAIDVRSSRSPHRHIAEHNVRRFLPQ